MAKNTTNIIAVDSLIFEDNVRTPACLNLPKMVESLKRHGFKVNHPLVVSKRSDDQYLVLCGNRRGLALQHLRDNEPDEYQQALPSGKVPAIVHEGLTPEQETLLRIDHSPDEDREPLDEWSQFLAVRQLVLIGHDSQEAIAAKLGVFHTKGKNKSKPNRSIIQPRVNLARLPSYVQDEMEKYCNDPAESPIRWSKIHALYKAFNKEFKEFPAGDGPLMSEAWEKAMMPPEKREKEATIGKSLTAKEAIKRAQACSSQLLAAALLTATDQGTEDMPTIDSKIKAAEQAMKTLNMLVDYHGQEFVNNMITEATEQCSEV